MRRALVKLNRLGFTIESEKTRQHVNGSAIVHLVRNKAVLKGSDTSLIFLEYKRDLRILGGKVLDGHDALSSDAFVVGADRQFLSNVAALSKVNAVHVV